MAKYLLGFRLISNLKANGLNWQPAAVVNIAKGEAIFDNGSGYATNVGTAFAATFLGIAAANADNSGGANGDISVAIIPPLDFYEWWVQNESATVAAQTDVGEIIDLESNNGVDVTDTTCVAYGFRVEGFDVSTDAVAAAAGGFVRGRIIVMDQD